MPRLKSKSVAALPELIGWRELVRLPELGLGPLIAKIDTGARSAALHAEDIHVQVNRVRFRVAINCRNHFCEAPVKGQRRVKNSSGRSEARLVIETFIAIGGYLMKGDITLTDRTVMGVPMLLGRAAIRGRFIVHPGRTFIISTRKRKKK